ncbi:MAG: hypothetical protein WDW38_000721 [Sanguina aurantia]
MNTSSPNSMFIASSGRFAEPERNARRRAVRIFHAQPVAFHPLDASFATRADDDKQHLLAATRNVQAQQEVIAEFAQLGTMGGKQMPSVLVKIEDQQLRHTSSAVAIMIKQVSLVDITYQLVKKAMAGEL